jgi:sec-independent protein translocase protein TatA
MPNPVLAEIIGPDILIVLVVILVLFGGSQLPKLARGLGSAQREFKKGLEEGAADDKDKDKSKPDSKSD